MRREEALSTQIEPRRALARGLWAGLLIVLMGGAGLAWWVTRPHAPVAPAPNLPAVQVAAAAESRAPVFQLALQVRPPQAAIALDAEPPVLGRLTRALPRDGRRHVLRISAPGYEGRTIEFRDEAPTESAIELTPFAAAPSAAPTSPAATGKRKRVPATKDKPAPVEAPAASAPLDIQLSR
jgi:hypothetical protein